MPTPICRWQPRWPIPAICKDADGNVAFFSAGYPHFLVPFFALIPLVGLRGANRGPLLLLYGTVILYCGIHAAAYVIYRYRLPAMPLMTVLAGAGIHYVYLWCSTARSRVRTHQPS